MSSIMSISEYVLKNLDLLTYTANLNLSERLDTVEDTGSMQDSLKNVCLVKPGSILDQVWFPSDVRLN